jgi:uncharacterized protein (TIGR03118 family)
VGATVRRERESLQKQGVSDVASGLLVAVPRAATGYGLVAAAVMPNVREVPMSSSWLQRRAASSWIVRCVVAAGCAIGAASASAAYVQTNLVSDATDSNLVNPWGLASTATSPVWVADNGSGKATLYNTAGTPLALVVSAGASPTGVVFNSLSGNSDFNGDVFLFAGLDGGISGWRGVLGTNAEILVSPSAENVYTGLAFAGIAGNGYAYAANFGAGRIDVFKGNAGAPDLAGNFTDPNLPAGYAPFNIQLIGSTLYVAYAQVDPGAGLALDGAGHGFIDAYSVDGNFLGRLVSQGELNSPWGLAVAPSTFGEFGGALLVGNNGDGLIHAFDPVTGTLLGTIADASNAPIYNDGLWGLRFGNGGNGGDADALYFTAGTDDGEGGLYGSIAALPGSGHGTVPEPASIWLLLEGVLALVAIESRRRAA